MAKQHVLIVDDEEDILQLVEYNLNKAAYTCTCVSSGPEAIKAARTMLPNLIVLDLMLPGIDGLQVCATLKHDPKTQEIPIVMLTAKGTEADIVRGLEMGADDYITKPFSPKVLVARIANVLRRQPRKSGDEAASLHIQDLVIHPGRREVLVDDEKIDLTRAEFDILQFLAKRPGWVFTRSQIVDALHGPGYPVTDRAVDVQVVGLRKKLKERGEYIETVRGIGYRFKE